jgi:glycosyltransferase involved in cell wall biosynthesis
MKKIILVARSDALLKPGGDYNLLKYLKSEFQKEEFDVTIIFSPIFIIMDYEAVVVCNIDRPHEAFIAASIAQKAKKPFFLIPLHHPENGMKLYLRKGTKSIKKLLAILVFFRPKKYEEVIAFFKEMIKRRIYLKSIEYEQKFLLENATSIWCSCQSESEMIKTDLRGIGYHYKIFPYINMVNRKSMGKSEEKNGVVICAGRIESRKNQLLVVKLAKSRKDVDFLFIGRENKNEKGYYRKFKKAIQGISNIKYEFELSLDDFRSELSKANALISASWFEVISIIELEAVSANCEMFVTPFTYLSDYINGVPGYFYPDNFKSLYNAFKKFGTKENTLALKKMDIPSITSLLK